MMLHGVTQMASNGWRALLWCRYVSWRAVAAYLVGCAIALGLWSLTRYVPSKPVALLMLGPDPVHGCDWPRPGYRPRSGKRPPGRGSTARCA
jgi:hypothetical protein